jgi:histidinol-phosphate aminotransferase
MTTNRRNWIKQVGLGVAGLGTSSLHSIANTHPVLTPESNKNQPIKLNSNENPYGVSPTARMAMADKIGISNRYDWELTSKLVSKIAEKNDVKEENVIMGAGSTEIIDFVVSYAAKNKGNFIVSEPTFSYWGETTKSLGLNKISIPLTTDKKYNLSGILQSITPDTRLVYICNPQQPNRNNL